jgi:hypothetical protein
MGTPAMSARVIVLAGILTLVGQAASARVPHRLICHHGTTPSVANRVRPASTPVRLGFRPVGDRNIHLTAYVPAEPALSQAAWRASKVAARNGDRDYLMIDKTHGKLIQFVDGAPVFIRQALTGGSLADRLPPDSLSKSYAAQYDVKYHVTPAGRFTVSRGFDPRYGATLDINEIKGKDWSIAIHTIDSASRQVRLRSPLDQDKHITEGCINVDADTMRHLAGLPAGNGRMPLYILPMDESLIKDIFKHG